MSAPTTTRIALWASDEGRELLEQLARKPGSLSSIATSFGLSFWEKAVLRRAINARKHAPRRRKLSAWTDSVAQTLDIFRADEQRLAATNPFPKQRRFKGDREHLSLLKRSVTVPNENSEWNAWRLRVRRVQPNLSGADLSGQSLQRLDMSKAQLNRSDLSAAGLRNARKAQLMHSRLWGTDLAGADLSGADLTGALLKSADLTEANLSGAILRDANLIGCTLNRTILKGADLRGALVWGINVWNIDYDETTRQTGMRLLWEALETYDTYNWKAMRQPDSSIQVDNLEMAQFMALVNLRRESLGEFFAEAAKRIVLVLGRFTGKHEEALTTVEEGLTRLSYVPVRFDFAPAEERDTIETIATLAGLCRFIVADFSEARSAPLEAQRIIPDFAVPFVPIRRSDTDEISMVRALQRKYPWVLRTFEYRDLNHLKRSLKRRVVTPAEKKSAELQHIKG